MALLKKLDPDTGESFLAFRDELVDERINRDRSN